MSNHAIIPIKNVFKCYNEAASKEGKQILEMLFPCLYGTINPCEHKNVFYKSDRNENGDRVRNYFFLHGNHVHKTFTIHNKYFEMNGKVKVTGIPYEFLDLIDYFK